MRRNRNILQNKSGFHVQPGFCHIYTVPFVNVHVSPVSPKLRPWNSSSFLIITRFWLRMTKQSEDNNFLLYIYLLWKAWCRWHCSLNAQCTQQQTVDCTAVSKPSNHLQITKLEVLPAQLYSKLACWLPFQLFVSSLKTAACR